MSTATASEESPQVGTGLPPTLVRVEITGVPTAETAECCCPEFCERDHDNE